ncbi:MAG: phosphotriesterase [Acidobacteria bacterium]|nr:phosphotriesterase [Acidobacteriota bacterium]
MPSSRNSGNPTRREFAAVAAAAFLKTEPSVLVHEHIMVDFTGSGRYDAEEVFRAAKPKLEEVRRLGCVRFHECTPNYLGRDAKLLARLADAAGMDIRTNTGIYGAADHKFVPPFARQESAGQLAKRWIAEFRNGVDGLKPRFIKTGVNRGPLDELDRKLVRAAAMASRETGLPIASHTGNGAAALEELEIVAAAKVPASRFIWVHAQNEKDHAIHEKVAQAGAWVEFDGIREKSAAWHLECVQFMASRGLLGRTLISQDSGWYRVGEPHGGEYRSYAYIYTDFLPRLKPGWARQLLWDNPGRAFDAIA